ncbi:hypothetical protein [Lysinibacillus fusiformis]|uniref:hypothetical protein n=1 Tax=Lysinibacillus fusiformis TaxID=28031 RepID=UPI003D02F8F1
MSDIEKAFWNHEAAKRLKVGESTLRKYCMELEKNGYTFIKGAMDSRAFTEKDLLALSYFQTLYKNNKVPRDEAARKVVERYSSKEGGNEVATPVQEMSNRSVEVLEQRILKMIKDQNKLLEHIENQEEFNRKLLQAFEDQNIIIKRLNEFLEVQEHLKLEDLQKAKDENAAAQDEKKKNKFTWIKKLFKQ